MKKKQHTPTPHDATFRQFLTQSDVARDFMELHLPAELRAICDLNTLTLEYGSFVEDDLRQYFSEVLYSLKTSAGDGYIYVLVEHQSAPDKHMAFHLIRYAVAAMQRHLDAGHKKLTLVIPVLFYTGKRSPYPYATRWLDEKAANMMKNRRLARSIGDAGWAGFITKLEYKAAETGVHLIKLDQWFASSKTCHSCGHKMAEMPLHKRLWQCPGCHTDHDRDVNAALNIKQQGIFELQAAGLVVSAHGGLRKSVTQTVAAQEVGRLARQGGEQSPAR